MAYAFVTTNLLDLWTEPRFNSERASQLLFGEIVRTTQQRYGYRRVYQSDGYSGWADERFLKVVSDAAARRFSGGGTHVVVASRALVFGKNGSGPVKPYFLYYSTKLTVGRIVRGMAAIELPDGEFIRLKAGALRPILSNMTPPVTGPKLAREARRFLGTPYLWGGLSPAGFDCSGLVRAVFTRFGRYVPRDTKDQIKVGRPVERDCIKSGDLVFFDRHVGIADGPNAIVHSSVGGGGVRVNSLVAGMPDYRSDLDRTYRQTRRVL